MGRDAKVTGENFAEQPIARGIKQAAAAVGVSPGFIRKAINAGELRRSRLVRRVLIREEDLRDWFDRSASRDEPQAA